MRPGHLSEDELYSWTFLACLPLSPNGHLAIHQAVYVNKYMKYAKPSDGPISRCVRVKFGRSTRYLSLALKEARNAPASRYTRRELVGNV